MRYTLTDAERDELLSVTTDIAAVDVVERIVAARVAEALAPVEALAEQWDDAAHAYEPHVSYAVLFSQHAALLRAAVEQGKAGQA